MYWPNPVDPRDSGCYILGCELFDRHRYPTTLHLSQGSNRMRWQILDTASMRLWRTPFQPHEQPTPYLLERVTLDVFAILPINPYALFPAGDGPDLSLKRDNCIFSNWSDTQAPWFKGMQIFFHATGLSFLLTSKNPQKKFSTCCTLEGGEN